MKEKLTEQIKNTGNVYLTVLRYVAMTLLAAVGLRLAVRLMLFIIGTLNYMQTFGVLCLKFLAIYSVTLLSFSFAVVLGRVKVMKAYSYVVFSLFTILLTVGMSLTAGMITSLYLLICNWL